MQFVIKYTFIVTIALIGLIFSFQLYKANLGDKAKQYQTSGVVLAITYYLVLYMNRKISNEHFSIKGTLNILLVINIMLTILLKYFYKMEKLKGKRTDLIVNIFFPLATLILFLLTFWIK